MQPQRRGGIIIISSIFSNNDKDEKHKPLLKTVIYEVIDKWGNRDYEAHNIIYTSKSDLDRKLEKIAEKYDRLEIEYHITEMY